MLVATETESRKQIAKTYPKISENVENGPPNADPFGGQFLTTGLFFLTSAVSHDFLAVPRDFGVSQEPSGPVRASIFTDFPRIWGSIFTDFQWIWTDLVIVVQSICQSVSQSVSQSVITQTTNHSVIHSDQSLLIPDHSFFWKNVRTSDQPPVCSLHAIPDVMA